MLNAIKRQISSEQIPYHHFTYSIQILSPFLMDHHWDQELSTNSVQESVIIQIQRSSEGGVTFA